MRIGNSMHWRHNQLTKQVALLSTCFGSHCSRLLQIRFLTSLSKPHCTIDLWETTHMCHMIDHDWDWGWLKLTELISKPSLVSSGAGCGHSGPYSVFDCSKWFGGLWDRQSGLAAFVDSLSCQKNRYITCNAGMSRHDLYIEVCYCIFAYYHSRSFGEVFKHIDFFSRVPIGPVVRLARCKAKRIRSEQSGLAVRRHPLPCLVGWGQDLKSTEKPQSRVVFCAACACFGESE